ncbi:imelysin family protein [Flexibacter flexilis]|nr:imelysin family protein [Flexibacter flexilis]
MLKYTRLSALALASLLAFASCDKDDDGEKTYPLNEAQTKAYISNYANIVYANYTDAYNKALKLQQKVNAFVASPTQITFDSTKSAWLEARNYYGQTEAFRFYGGPIDSETGPEGLINAWPIDESYIDYVSGNDSAGVINKPTAFPNITKELLISLNEKDGETNISTGYHAIEFLLWGQDLTVGPGAGQRPYTDYVDNGTAKNQARRRQYLQVVTNLLVEHLATVLNDWKPNASNYRSDFETDAIYKSRFQDIVLGIASLSKGELAGERMYVAYDEKDREHEHSCFSDNTKNDIIANATGIQNVYLGYYKKADGTVIDGTGLDDIIKSVKPELAQSLTDKIAAGITAANALQNPFDQEFLDSNPAGRVRMKTCIDTYTAQGDLILDGAKLFGIKITLE